MRISLKWLSEYVDLPPPDEVVRRLTGIGLEVEAVERPGDGLRGIVVARILAAERHPGAEKLWVATVDAGRGAPLRIVCGAKNCRAGDLVPLAPAGTVLPGGKAIQVALLRGVESAGMLCSAAELELGDDGAGLMILDRALVPGTPLAEALGLDDVVLEINVTTNRPDALSHVGVARELAAASGRPLRLPEPGLAETDLPAAAAVRVRIEAPDRCARYAARVIEGVTVGPSPAWLARRLEACGVRSISNVVDATNLVLLELGHPLHAFDLEKVAGAEIVVRTARPGEALTTLDGVKRTLQPDDLLICDSDRGSALAGIMGGGDSEISAGTSRVLLESAWFAPSGIRRTARRHALHTEASHRFERGADPGMVIPALDRCAALIASLAAGRVRRGAVDAHPRPWVGTEIRLRWSRPAALLGLAVPREQAASVLRGLGFEERAHDGEGATWSVPSWRVDVAGEEDLVEEIARSVGYDAIPETLPRPAGVVPRPTPDDAAAERVRSALEAAGFSEAVNYSFVPRGDLAAFGASPVVLKNPISAEMAAMRTSLVPSLLRNAGLNRRQGTEDVRLYEVASIYLRRADDGRDPPADERRRAAGLILGRRSPLGWSTPGDRADPWDAKAATEQVLEALGVAGARFERDPATPWLHPRSAAALRLQGGQAAGVLGEIHPRVAEAFEVPRGAVLFELDLDALFAASRPVQAYRPFPRLPAVLRDLAVVVVEEVEAETVLAAVRSEPLVEEVTLFDVYRGAPLPAGKKNLAMAIHYRVADRTLTDAEADAAHGRIVARLRDDPAIRAELRA